MKTEIKKRIIASLMGVVIIAGLCSCGNKDEQSQQQQQAAVAENATRVAEIDISKDNTADMPTAEEVISGGTTQELVERFEGEKANAALTVNGEPVSEGVMQFALNDFAMKYGQTLMLTGVIKEDANSFDWSAKDPNYEGSYLDYVKYNTLEDIIPRFALVAEGKRRGVTFTEEDRKDVLDWLAKQQEGYGDVAFTGLLNQNGCPSIDAFVGFRELAVLEAKVVEDFEKDPEKYAPKELLRTADERDLVTVKHILVAFDTETNGAQVTDEAKAAAKAKAEEVLAKVNAGEDFDKLIDEYTDDVEESKKGYTFANDGTMVQEFADASFALEIGETSGLVETQYGYHIIRRMERAVTITDYLILLNKNAKVVLNNSVFNNLKVTVDMELYLNSVSQAMSNR